MDHRLRADSLSDRRKKPEPPDDNPKEPRYHVYIRLPFNRPPGFVEPGTVCHALYPPILLSTKPNLMVKGELE